MSDAVDRALQAFQAAFAAAKLYSPEHSAVRAHEERAAQLLAEALQHAESVSIVLLENRVVVNDQALPSGERLLDGALGSLRREGVELLAFTRGVDRDVVHGLLLQVLDGRPGKRNLRGGRCVRLGFLEGLSGSGRLGAAPSDPRAPWIGACQSIESAWNDMLSGQSAGGEVNIESRVGGAVAQICSVAAASRASLLPLANLKRHDEYTFVHTYNVAMMSSALAATLGLSADAVHDITLAAMLHDVGKQRVPLEILNKNGALSDDELRVMRQHPEFGARLLMETGGVPDVAIAVTFEHHMNLDGTGYPTPPKPWSIGLASQIVHVADIFDALRTNRPYRAAMPASEAFATLRKGAGVWFDAPLLEVFEHRVACRVEPGTDAAAPQ